MRALEADATPDRPGLDGYGDAPSLQLAPALPAEPWVPVPRRNVLGLPVDACSTVELVATIEHWVDADLHHMAVGVNANVINMAHTSAAFRDAVSTSGLNYPDGQSVVWACRLLGFPVPERLATTDVIFPLTRNWALRGFRVFLYGGEPGVAQAAADRLVELNPGLQIVGVQHGYASAAEQETLTRRINESGAQVLLTGLGNPRQELWVHEHIAELTPNAILTCGGLFDWTAGRHRRPPEILVAAGLEWLWRLILEPRRLFRRYVVGNPLFAFRLAKELCRQRIKRLSGFSR